MTTRIRYRTTAVIIILVITELLTAMVLLACWWLFLRELNAFRFEREEMLRTLLLMPLLALVFVLHLAWRNKAMRRFASESTLSRAVPGVSTTRSLLRFLFLRHGLGFVIIALAGPQFGTRLEEVRSKGVDLVVAVDVSNSMVAEDLRPSRMEVTRRALSRLIDQLRGDRLGMIVFAGEAYVQLPITTDRSAARMFLSSIDTDAVPTQGTAIGAAIDLARRSFDPDRPGSRAIIIISDGEDHQDDAEGAAREAAEEGIVVHTIGMGTSQGAPLPLRRNGRITGFKKDRDGNTVVSRLNENMLMRIAAAGNGTYVRATERSTGIEELLAELREMDPAETGTWRYAAHEAQFQYPLGVGAVLIILGMCFSERKRGRSTFNWTA